MYPLLAVTIENSSILFCGGAIALLIGLFLPGEKGGKIIAGVGVLMLVGGFLMKPSNAVPAPQPLPYPAPYPPSPYPNPNPIPGPQPLPFSQGVLDAFKGDGGTKDDAIVLSSAFDQFGSSLEYDGLQQPPRIASTTDLGSSFARLQQYRFLSQQTTLGQRFPRFEAYIAAEMARTGLNAGPLDAVKRSNAVLMFRTIATSLKGV